MVFFIYLRGDGFSGFYIIRLREVVNVDVVVVKNIVFVFRKKKRLLKKVVFILYILILMILVFGRCEYFKGCT